MSLTTERKALLTHLSRSGDIYARDALAQEASLAVLTATGRAGFFNAGAPAAKSATSVHASLRGDAALNPFPGPVTNPVTPRNLRMVFGALWDGGNVTVVGTNQLDVAVTEVFTGTGGTTQVGVKVFKTVTTITKASVGVDAGGTNTVTVGTGDMIGLLINVLDTFGMVMVDGVPEKVTMDATYEAFTPTTAPDGSKVFTLLINR